MNTSGLWAARKALRRWRWRVWICRVNLRHGQERNQLATPDRGGGPPRRICAAGGHALVVLRAHAPALPAVGCGGGTAARGLARAAGRGRTADPPAAFAAGGSRPGAPGDQRTLSGRRGFMSARPNILITPSTQKQGAEFLDASISLSDRYPAAVLA